MTKGLRWAAVWCAVFIYHNVSRTMKPSAAAVAASASERTFARFELGAVALAGIAHVYWANWEWHLISPTYFLGRFLEGQMINGGYWAVAVLLGMLIVFAGAGRNIGRVFNECLPSVLAMGTIILCGLSLVLMGYTLPAVSESGEGEALVASLALVMLTIVLLVALSIALFQGVKYRFRASESARALLPLSVLLVGLWAVCTSVMRASTQGLEAAFPLAFSVLFAFLCPLGACAWAVWELRVLRRSVGIFTPRSIAMV